MTELLLVGSRDGELRRFNGVIRSQEPNWSVLHSAHAASALDQLKRRPANIVLACLDEVVEFESLFARVSETSPGAVRLALCQPPPPVKVRGAHQILATRGDLTSLHATLLAAAEVSAISARHSGLQHLVSRFDDVPSPPLLYFDIREQLDSESGTAASMAEVASRDPALVARTLKMANSGYYARPRSVGDLTEAITLLGADTLLALVLAAHLYAGLPPPGLRLDSLWKHSLEVSVLAREISRIEGADRHQLSHSFIAGLLHDIGLLVLLQNESARYQPLWGKSGGNESELIRLERDTFGTTHGELGAVILKLWNLPAEVVGAVANSHACSDDRDDAPRPLPLPDRAVMAAEWLLDPSHARDEVSPPGALAGTPEVSLQHWLEARDQVLYPNC